MDSFGILSIAIIIIGILMVVFLKKDTHPIEFEFLGFKFNTKEVGFAFAVLGFGGFGWNFLNKNNAEKNYYLIGKITDQHKNPIEGAYVYLSYGPDNKTISDTDISRRSGEFTLSVRRKDEVTATIHWGIGKFKYDSLTALVATPHKDAVLLIDTSTRKPIQHLNVISNLPYNLNTLLENKLNSLMPTRKQNKVRLIFNYQRDLLFFHEDGALASYNPGGRVQFSVNGRGGYSVEGETIPEIQAGETNTVKNQLGIAERAIIFRHIDTICNKVKQCLEREDF